jgi:Domain of unknown function (DUF4253)
MTGTGLPENGEVQVGNVQLPAGRQVVAGYGAGSPVAWATVQPVTDPGRIWQALSDIVPDSGLVPFLLSGLDETTARPWDAGEFSEPADISELMHLDAGRLLAGLWRDQFEVDEESGDEDEGEEWDEEFAAMIAPFSRQFPGLAPGSDEPLTEQAVAHALAAFPPARIGLATASRPADVLPLIGWDGAANHWESALVIAAVLRSWEERFGARLLRVGFAEVELLVRRPPRTRAAAQRLAAEQFAFCDECAGQGLHDVSSITDHLLASPTWTFWWD